ARLCPHPQITARCNLQRESFPQIAPLADVAPIQMKPLDAPVLTVGHIKNPIPVDGDPVRQMELPRPFSRRSPFANPLASAVVLETPRVGIPIRNEDAPARGEGDI